VHNLKKEEGHYKSDAIMGISTNSRVGNETSFNNSSSSTNVSKSKKDENTGDTFQSIMGLVNVSKNQTLDYSNDAKKGKSIFSDSSSSKSKKTSTGTYNSTYNNTSNNISNSSSSNSKEISQYKTSDRAKSTDDSSVRDDSISSVRDDSASTRTSERADSDETTAKNVTKKSDKNTEKVTDKAGDTVKKDGSEPADAALQDEPEPLDELQFEQLSSINDAAAILAGMGSAAFGTELDATVSDTDIAAVTDLSELTAPVVENIAQILDVTTEQVEQGMQELDIDVGDLLDVDNVKALVLNVRDADNIDMLVDESLGQQMSDISGAVQELVEGYQDDQSAEPVLTAQNVQGDTDIRQNLNTTADQNTIASSGDTVAGTENQSGQNNTYSDVGDKPTAATTVTDGEVKSDTYTDLDDSVQKNVTDVITKKDNVTENRQTQAQDTGVRAADTTVVEKTVNDTVKDTDSTQTPKSIDTTESFSRVVETTETNQENSGASNYQSQNQQGNSLDSSLIGDLTQALTEAVSQNGELNDFDGDVQAADIVRQVVEEIKTNVNDKIRSLEIKLNPESLGRVQITVTTKNGVMQARIIAENEAAKNAIEGSINLLKETFNEQNLKVDAVEVTIANYDFFKEDNEAQNNENNQKNTSSGGNKDAGNDDIVKEDVSDAEQIERDMMQQSGNSVSYAI
jgi:flagellar hook-length control protein FliK